LNILFLCKKVPFPSTDGESLVIMNDLKVLKALGHHVSLFCLNTRKHWVDTKDYMEMSLWDNFYAEELDTNSFITFIRATLSAYPFQIARFYNSDIAANINNFIKQKNIEIIIYQGLAMTQYQRSAICKKVYRIHNIEYKVWSLLAIQSKNYLRKLFNYWISKSLNSYEAHKLKDLSAAITLSYEEKNGLQEFYTTMMLTTIPISINSEYRFKYSAENKGILFIGSLDWQPNIEGLDWFLKYVYPGLNNMPLTIAGKGDFKCDLENVTIIPNYENTEELLANHRLMIVPLLSGAGIRIKILEAMKFGMPCMSTTVGAEGILHNGAVHICNSPIDWIMEINRLYANEKALMEISEKLKQSYWLNYSEEAISRRWQEVLERT
jgi:polysaccharide biosynthesis protein PslH